MDCTPCVKVRLFPNTPDTSCYYPATSHELALDQLMKGLQNQESIMVLTGETGTGKTLLSHCLLERLRDNRPSLVLTNSHVRDRSALYQALLYDLNKPYEGRTEQEMRLALTDHLLGNFQQGLSTVILIDEAQHLSLDLLEELRLLGNLESGSQRAVQIILLGQPRLRRTLQRPELKALNQRIVVQSQLNSLDTDEAADYILHHVRLGGPNVQNLFSSEAIELMILGTQGIPRLINKACQLAIEIIRENELAGVDAEVVLEVFSILGIMVPETEAEKTNLIHTEEHPHPGSIHHPPNEMESNVLAFETEETTTPNEPLIAPRRPA